MSHDGGQQRDAVCGLRNAGFKTRTCRPGLSLPGDSSGTAVELDGFLAGDPTTSSVSVGLLSPPGTDARYTRRPRTTAAAADDPVDAASTKNLANSRRKTDKPRKRKRASSDLAATAPGGDKTAREDTDRPAAVLDAADDCAPAGMDAVADPATSSGGGAVGGSPLPEDLSTVRAVADGCPSPEPLASPTPSHDTDAINHQAWMLANQATQSNSSVAAGIAADYGSSSVPGTASSVHDLEAAMNKHLPSSGGTSAAAGDLVNPYLSGAASRSHRSAAIQWISTGQDATSTLLRSMYPGQRESVIRTNVYSATPRGQYYPSSTADAQSALLTPPGAAESAFVSAAFHHNHAARTPPSGALNHAGGAGYGLGHGGDAYAMTPPSSVSPQDALAAGAVSQYALEHPLSADGFYPTSSQNASQHLHHYQHHHHHHPSQLSAIKPLHYGAGVYENSMSYHQAAAAAAMAAGYYSSNGGGGSLASYSAHYRDAMKHANATW